MIALYTRVSTSEQAENGYSIDEQAERLKNYCAAMGYAAPVLFSDPGFSGGNMERPALKKLIREVNAGRVEKVIVYKLDRLSRSQLDTLFLIEKVFTANGCDFVSLSESFDTSSAFGKATIGILAVFAQLEREQIKERLTMGKIARAKEGKYHGSSTIPIGYDYKDGQLVVNPYEEMQVLRVFREFAAGKTPPAIARDLNAEGYTQKGRKWSKATVREIVTHKIYIGFVNYLGEWYLGQHQPIIPPDLFEAARRVRDKRADDFKRHNRRAGKATSYLGGFLYCAHCGAKYTRKISTRTDKNGERVVYRKYECLTRAAKDEHSRKRGKCANKIWGEDELNGIIFDEIRKLKLEDYTPAAPDTKQDAEVIAGEIASIDAKIDRLMDLYADGDMPRAALQEKVHALNDRREKLETEAERIAASHKTKIPRESIAPVLGEFDAILSRGGLDEVRAVIGSLIDKIVLDGDGIAVYWNFE